MMILVTGGSSCGKSAFAESLIVDREKEGKDAGQMPSFYLATMIAWDAECKKRIQKHREMRKDKHFETIECPVDLLSITVPKNSRCLLECMSNLVANEMYREDRKDPGENASFRILSGIRKLKEEADLLVIVTNDVFGDQGIYSKETEDYRRLLGTINQELACEADQVYEVLYGSSVAGKKRTGGEAVGMKSRNGNEKRTEITLLVGGAYQGKRKLAVLKAKEKKAGEIVIADGSTSLFSQAFSSDVIENLHQYIRRILDETDSLLKEEREKRTKEVMDGFLDELLTNNPTAIITCDEIGCGIVPITEKERLWRELTGDACQYLAARAKKVSRVVCGLEFEIKGGEA